MVSSFHGRSLGQPWYNLGSFNAMLVRSPSGADAFTKLALVQCEPPEFVRLGPLLELTEIPNGCRWFSGRAPELLKEGRHPWNEKGP